ncbi:TPA: hypothetical protein RQ813_006626 [Pseudomonas aeruginosa]|nr:hypothetical protein [Pseudomonas aeruginosa]
MNKALAEQAGGDERAAFELFVRKHCGMPAHIAVNWDAKFTNDAWEGWKARAALAQPSPKCATCGGTGMVDDGEITCSQGGIPYENGPVKCVKDCPDCKAQPSPAQAEQAEAERPEVVAFRYRCTNAEGEPLPGWFYSDDAGTLGLREPLTTVAECDRIVGALREQYECNTAIMHARTEALSRVTSERDAALSRVAELEKQEPVATVAKVPGEDWNSLDFHRDLQDMQPGTKLYAAPLAQAQQLHDLDKQCRDDVARALGLRPNQERGFAWSYLLASIKSCVKASEDSAQAQRSVPGDIMRDAQRYRWLRDQQFYFSFSTENSDAGISSCTAGMSSRFKNLSWVDAAIDSAIAAAPGKEVGHE